MIFIITAVRLYGIQVRLSSEERKRLGERHCFLKLQTKFGRSVYNKLKLSRKDESSGLLELQEKYRLREPNVSCS